jgi:glycosyltransferase involved in cell wall biosynthesis
VRALAELFPQRPVTVFSKNDRPGEHDIPEASKVHAFGHFGRRMGTVAMSATAITAARVGRAALCIATHPHFAKGMRFTGRPYIAVEHGIETWGQIRGAFKKALSGAAGHLPVSEFTRQVLINEGGIDSRRVIVVPDTFREEAFAPGAKPEALLRRHGLSANQPVLLTVGRLAASEAYKGHDQVIMALAQVRRTHPEVRYIIAGTGNDEPRLRQCVAAHGQQDAVIFAGFVPDAELADYYRLCDAFVMPSTGEGFGIVYLEALASGRPCIAGDRDASPEAIGHGRLGFVVDPRSPSQIADAILKLITRQHDKPWLNEPETLRREVVELYGFAAFKRSLGDALHTLIPDL